MTEGTAAQLPEHLVDAPDDRGLVAMVRTLGGGVVSDVVRLRGGLDCATHMLTVGGRRVVLKRYKPGNDGAAIEHANLHLAQRCAVTTPSPVALDAEGSWFGRPALVMTALDGRLNQSPDDLGHWSEQLAETLVAIHRGPTSGLADRRPPAVERWALPADPDARLCRVDRAVQRLRALPAAELVFSHTDFHPGNVLFDGDDVVGVVDWRYVTLEARQATVANARADLAVHPGGEAPDIFLAAYENALGRGLAHMPMWDALMGVKAYRWGWTWAPAFDDVGIPLSAEAITARAAAFLDRSLEAAGV